MGKLNLFIPITKIDEENRLVYGRIAAEEIDNSGEMFDYASSKPNFEKWSNDQLEASGGLSKGNVRAMHGNIAAGRMEDISFNDDSRVIEGCAKIVDDNEWQKCLAGVYTGFSMGGRYAKRWNENGVTKYTALPSEVSIVDKPCIKSARFADLVKADGSIQQLELGKADDHKGDGMDYLPTNDELAARGMRLAKAAGKGEAQWIDFAAEARDQLVAEHLAKADGGYPKPDAENDGDGDDTKPEVKKDDGGEMAMADGTKPDHTDENCKVGDDCEKCAGMAANKSDSPAAPEQGWRAADGSFHLKKSDAIAANVRLTQGPSLADQIADLGKMLKGDATDEGGDDKGDGGDKPLEDAIVALEKAAEAGQLDDATQSRLAKAIAPAAAPVEGGDDDSGDKEPGDDRMAKFDGMVEENELLKGEVALLKKQVSDAGPAIAELRKEIELIKSTPIPGGPARTAVVVDKADDRLGKAAMPNGEEMLIDALQKLSADELANLAIRASQQQARTISA